MSHVPKEKTTTAAHLPTVSPSNLFNCNKCPLPDAFDNMVECDQCQKWYHYKCAKVGDSVEHLEVWKCDSCCVSQLTKSFSTTDLVNLPITSQQNQPIFPLAPSATRPNSTKPSAPVTKAHSLNLPRAPLSKVSSTKSSHGKANLLLRQLEEETRLREKREQDYLKKKYEILELDLSDEGDNSDESKEDVDFGRERVEQWINNSTKGDNENDKKETHDLKHCSLIPNVSNACAGQYLDPSGVYSLPKKRTIPPQCAGNLFDPSGVYSFPKNQTIPLQESSLAVQSPMLLSQQQLATRQIMSKECVKFSGKAEEWPMFIAWFENTSVTCAYNNHENLQRLQRCLTGQALEAVRFQLMYPDQVNEVVQTLKMLYGRPEIIIQSLLTKIRNEPYPKADKLETIISFSLSVGNVCSVMQAAGLSSHLNNPFLLQELIDRLPSQLKLNWGMFKQSQSDIDLLTFRTWLSQVARAASEVTISVHDCSELRTTKKSRGYMNIHQQEDKKDGRRCPVCEKSCRSLTVCESFLNMNPKERWEVIRHHFICRTCLRQHGRRRCSSSVVCGYQGCSFRHNSLLHINRDTVDQGTSVNEEPKLSTGAVGAHLSCPVNRQGKGQMLFKILPVTLYFEDKKVETYAFLDDGSSVTLMDEELAQSLKARGNPEPLCLKWTGNTHRNETNSRNINLEISSSGARTRFYLPNVHTVKSLDLPKQTLNIQRLANKYEHLKNLPIVPYTNAKPRILIGLQHWNLGIPLKSAEGNANQPVAIKTRIGWTVFGSTLVGDKDLTTENVHQLHICECQNSISAEMHQLMKEYFKIDGAGASNFKKKLSAADERAQQKLETETKFDGKNYIVPLLWKYDIVSLPRSKQMAEKRLRCLEKKLSKEPDLRSKINQSIKQYIEKGYATKLSESEASSSNNRTWYLPIFPVINPNKPNKVRIVWDAAAKVEGVSLNSVLLTGPDEVPALISILFRFRERRFALAADIREMFHQIKINDKDQESQRFLWLNEDSNEVEEYKMAVMTFGSTCSPYCAQFIKNKNAKKFAGEFPRASNAIIENHYVDDFLDSVDDEEEAIKLAKDVIYIHSQAGFEIRNFLSNSNTILNALNEKSVNENKFITSLNLADNAEKLLGMWWAPQADTFLFTLQQRSIRIDVIRGETIPTKREVLKVLMCVFDPLGLIAHFVIILKILLQDIWRTSTDWDQQINYLHFERWKDWLKLIPIIRKITIGRSYLSNLRFDPKNCVQLHIFVDASESAYATVAYFRVKSQNLIECSLIGAKTKVGPIKTISIPRMELEAAVLGIRFAQTIAISHSINISQTFYWTDSRIVLCWIKSEHRKYKQFVAYRVSEILESSNEKEWRWISTKENVADDATKQKPDTEFHSNSRWYKGPNFLYTPEERWEEYKPQQCAECVGDHEIKICCFQCLPQNQPVIDYTRFSQWARIVRTTMYVYRFIDIKWYKRNVKGSDLFTSSEHQRAENCLYRLCQREGFIKEYETFYNAEKSSEPIQLDRSSVIYKLTPYMDDNAVLRIRGRIDAAPTVQEEVKRPIILPKNHYITNLIIKSYHNRFHHLYNETVVNEMRQVYHISNLRSLLKNIKRDCNHCKKRSAVPSPPIMGQLPAARLSSYTRAFSYVGIDYFGPLYVKVGRHREKRWGMLLTCLTVRAIHIEIAHSLSSDSCISGLKRFIARRGMPIEIYSDNGTNFRGASEELKQAILNSDQNKVAKEFEMKLTWKFLPPASPHMGGCWERLVRSVKQTLAEINPSSNPSDELLLTMMAEVENIINTRPLTYIPIDENDKEALTPNHFLIGSSSGIKINGKIVDSGAALKKNWIMSEKYANSFWKRWVTEYLPNLTRRQKWFKSGPIIKEGDIVIIVDSGGPRRTWPMGKVIKALPGSDGVVRSAVVQTSFGIYTRPVVKLAVLDVKQFGEDGNSVLPGLPGGSVTELGSTHSKNGTIAIQMGKNGNGL